ncbi:hypothetical protein HJC23_008094 [Cyclotella cryptica]|uniref:VPS9 domain-containing protein n=1 Tax=Cyclotella cryptica TaxID=29204 RepID=A0ABD3PFB2_9STRA
MITSNNNNQHSQIPTTQAPHQRSRHNHGLFDTAVFASSSSSSTASRTESNTIQHCNDATKSRSPIGSTNRKKRPNRKFLPMVSKLRNDGTSESSSDSDYDTTTSTKGDDGTFDWCNPTQLETLSRNDSSGHCSISTMDPYAARWNAPALNGSTQHDFLTGDNMKSKHGPWHHQEQNNWNASFASLPIVDDKEKLFQSTLGQRIWREYRLQVNALQRDKGTQYNSNHVERGSFVRNMNNLPSNDFLRLPPTMVRLKHSSVSLQRNGEDGSTYCWVDIRDLERKVLQNHIDHNAHAGISMRDEKITWNSNQLSSLSPSLLNGSECLTKVLHRDPKVGLGMSLREYDGCVYVQAVLRRDGTRMDDFEEQTLVNGESTCGGPAFEAGLRPGDRLLGMNGRPFLKGRLAASIPLNNSTNGSLPNTLPMEASSEEVLKSVGDAISRAPSPLVLHFQKTNNKSTDFSPEQGNLYAQSRVTATQENSPKRPVQRSLPILENGSRMNAQAPKAIGPYIHPFAKALSKRNLIQPGHEELVITQQMRVLCDRTRQWESKLSFRLRASDFKLRPQLDPRDVEPTYYASFFADDSDAPPFFSYKYAKNVRSYAPSTPMIQDWRLSREGGESISPIRPPNRQMSREAAVLADLYAGLDEDDAEVQDLFLGGNINGSNGTGIRQGGGGLAYPLSERYFATNDTKSAHDIVVPLVGVRKAICVRILNSFLDSRNRVAFSIWCYDVESGMEWFAPVRYHEDFRDLRLALLRIDKAIAEIPFPNLKWGGFGLALMDSKETESNRELRRDQLERFLRRVFAEVYRGKLHPYLAEVAIHLQTFVGCDGVLSDDFDSSLALNHQVAISETTYGRRPDPKSEPDRIARVQLKRSVQRYVYRIFLIPSVETLVTRFVDATKKRMQTDSPAMQGNKNIVSADVEKIRNFIDQVQDLILEGCNDDFTSITQRRDFAAINDISNIEDFLREAVREQVELEVYVPLRTTISKFLVRAFYNEDVEMKHKMKALESKQQAYFRIQPEHRSPSDWKSVSKILSEGVGRSTLPSVKLRAIVEAAKEITRLHSEERGCFSETSFFDGPVKTKTLGADDFLPIFIFCFVRAKLDRPCALCELLQTMCDPLKLNGETGYYLASFNAAMMHINQLDLTDANDEFSIFLDVLPD